MASETSNPARRGASAGLGNVQLGGKNSTEATANTFHLQATMIARRFGLPLARARLVAELAFSRRAPA